MQASSRGAISRFLSGRIGAVSGVPRSGSVSLSSHMAWNSASYQAVTAGMATWMLASLLYCSALVDRLCEPSSTVSSAMISLLWDVVLGESIFVRTSWASSQSSACTVLPASSSASTATSTPRARASTSACSRSCTGPES